MKNKFLKLFLLAILLSPVFLLSPKVDAQTGDCDVVTVTTRTTRPLGPAFFNENNRPYFYIDIVTQNCMNESLEVSITEDDVDGDPDDDVNDSSGMDNRVINVNSSTTNSFTLALIAGEDECEVTYDPECAYHIETWDDVDDFEWTQVSGYDCDGVCDMDWEYLGIIPHGTIHTNDPDGPNNGGGNTNQNNTGTISTNSGGSTVINLNLINPIGGSASSTTDGINSLPEFFQKVIEIIIKIAIPFTAIVLVYCGLLFVTARGDASQIEKARNAFTYAVIGGLVLLSSWLIAEAIQDALTSLAYAF